MEVVTVIDKPIKAKQGMEVYCRIKGGKKCSDSCMNIISSNEVQICRTDGKPSVRYKFKKVFDESASQKYVFDEVAFKLIQDLLSGRSGLLFAYGVTGSGKTYTMTGTKEEPGIMPRCLDVLFNSIAPFQVDKCVFKPDKLNGFEMQSSADAQLERDCVIHKQIVQFKNVKYTLENKGSEERWGWSKDFSRVPYLNEDNSFAVFITYVEIYNNNVYDLLEDFHNDVGKPRPLQSKIIREDSTHTMYVHGVTEIEVSSTEEAFDIFYTGERRKHIARTTLNNESSRAHTVFNIRVVQAPLDEAGENVILDKNFISISQLSLVDLAGSERSLRTLNTGQRLREAGNINNSLMTLRTCLEILRDNQNGCNKIIPYRESRLTHLFKNYFDGDGQVSMIICASPSLHDLDETVHVMKFAEMTQEIQMSQQVIRPNLLFTPGRRKVNQAFKGTIKEHVAQVHDYNAIVKDPHPDEKESVTSGSSKISDDVHSEDGVKTPLDIICDFPSVGFVDYNENRVIGNAANYWERYIETFTNVTNSVITKFLDVREKIVKKERDKFIMAQELKSVKSLYEVEKNKVADLESKSRDASGELNQLKRKLNDCGLAEKKLKRQLFETKMELERVRIENNNIKERIKTKVRETEEKCNQELEKVLQNQKNVITHELRKKDRKLREVKRIVTEVGGSKTPSLMSLDIQELPVKYKELQAVPKACESSASITPRTNSNNTDEQSNSRTTIRKVTRIPTSNRRHRRSRSADVWLDHRPAMVVPLGTVMQPKMEKRKSITKLTHSKDVTERASKYCLMTQSQDSDGDLETRLYKGDVIPTSGGGAQVMFNDIEILKQTSPSS